MTYDDLIFYLPAIGSFAIVGVSMALTWLVWRLIAARAKREAVEKSKKT